MTRGSYYTFETEDSLGIIDVPENKLVYVKSFFGKPKMFILKENVTSAWSILRAVQQRKLFSESEEVRNIISDLTPMFSMPLESDLTIVQGVGAASFDRASSATYIDKDGILQYAAIDEARFEAKGYLNETASTNQYTYSNDYSDSSWTKKEVTFVANYIVAPDGATTATIFADNTVSSAHGVRKVMSNRTAGDYYTTSVFVKAGTMTNASIYSYGDSHTSPKNPAATFSLTAETVVTNNAAVFATKMEKLADGWFRISATFLCDATGTNTSGFYMNDAYDTSLTYVGDGLGTMYFWGAQYELTQFPSSYIPTTTTTVTRARDGLVVDFKDNHPDILNGDYTCSLDVDITRGGVTRTVQQVIFDGGFNAPNINKYSLLRGSSNANTYQLYRSGGDAFGYTFVEGENNKITWSTSKGVGSTYASTVKTFVNGKYYHTSLNNAPLVSTETSHATHIGIGIKAYDKVAGIDGHIKNVKIVNKELSDTACSLL